MIRVGRIVAALLVLGLALGGPTLRAGAQEAETGAPETPDGGPAIDELVGCVQASQHLLVLFLIDESASLKESDPGDRRVDAARAALDSLLALATAEGAASPSVDISLAAFSNEYRLIQDWTVADAAGADELTSSLDGFAELDRGIDTDFVNALTAGQESLAARSAEVTETGGTAPCRAVLLFTDGGFDLAVRESAEDQERLGTTKPYAPGIELTTPEAVLEAEAAGRAALCDPGGVADRLRNDRATLLTVALSGNVARRSQLPLASATTGRADDYTCGTPTDRPTGAYLPAEGVDVLVARFNEVGVRLAGGNLLADSDQVVVCGEDPCADGSTTFALDASLRRAQILALPPEAGAVVRLESPDGSEVDLTEAGDSTVGDQQVSVRSVAGRGLSIDLVRPDGAEGWAGDWTVSILDPSGEQEGEDATLQVFVFSDITVEITKPDTPERGKPATFTVELAAPEGIDLPSLVASAEGEVRLRDPITGEALVVPVEGPPEGPFTAVVDVPADLRANAVDVSALMRLETESGAELVSQSAPIEVFVRRPGGAVQFLPPSLNMPSLTGLGTTETELLLVGGEAAGCVWFGALDVASAPDGAAPFEVTIDGQPLPDEEGCIQVPAGETITASLAIEPADRASGSVTASLEVFERVEGAEASTTDLAVRIDLARGVDTTRRLLLAVGLLAAGLAIPMLALLVINALTARFQSLDAVQGAALPVRVSQGVIHRTGGDHQRSFSLRANDFGSLAGRGTDRRFSFGGVTFRAQASRNPFGATIAMAAPDGGAEKLKGKAGSRVELDPALAGSWVFLLDPAKTRRAPRGDADGLLIAFVTEGDVAAQLARMQPDIAKRLPQTASKLAGLVRATTPKARKQPVAKASEAEAPEVEEVDEVDEVEAEPAGEVVATPADEPAVEVAEEAAPAAPLGFSGTSAAAPPPIGPVDDDPEDPDAGPAAPPTGFTGGRPPG